MMRQLKISIIVPTYKPQSYLWECLDSIYNQTLEKSDYELILVLNGCNEPYNSQIRDWVSEHNGMHVQYIQTDMGGVSNARNIALDAAKGEYVTFIDDDDYISTTFLESLMLVADENTIAIACPHAFKDCEEDEKVRYPLTDLYNRLYSDKKYSPSKVRRFFSGPCMKLIPMSFIQGRLFDTRFSIGEDGLFMFLISDRFDRIRFASPDAIYYRRYRDNSLITSPRTKKQARDNSINLLKVMLGYFFRSPFKYNLEFSLLQIVSVLKSVIKPNIYQ